MCSRKIIAFSIFCIFSLSSISQVNFLSGDEWKEAKAMAIKTSKPIYIDFYTSWCPPCKKMDKTTFADSTISVLLNEQFIAIKMNGEKLINKEKVTNYDIKVYPTSVFLNSNGKLVSKEEGYFSAQLFEEKCTNLLSFLNDDLKDKMELSNIDKFTDEELDRIISNYSSYDFKIMPSLKNKFYDRLKRGESVSKNAGKFLVNSYEENDPYPLLIKAIPDSLWIMNSFQWSVKFMMIFETLYKNAIEQGDKIMLEKVSTNFLKFDQKLKDSGEVGLAPDREKAIRSKRLSFYSENGHLNAYFVLADSLLNEYVLKHTPESVKKRDEWNSRMMTKLKKKEPAKSDYKFSPKDSLGIKHLTASLLSTRFNEICETVAFYPFPRLHVSKALEWIEQSTKYLDLPETRIIKAALLRTLDRPDESKLELRTARSSPYFDKSCELLITKFQF